MVPSPDDATDRSITSDPVGVVERPADPAGQPAGTGPSPAEQEAVGGDDEPHAIDVGEVEGEAEPDRALTPEELRRQRIRSAVEWVAVLAGAVVVALVVRTFLFTTFWIPSGSMEPTLQGEGRRDRVIVNRLSYKLHDVNRGDIIVFEVPEGEPTMAVDGQQVNDLIKRVVGLPGETVELRDGEVYVDGTRLEEAYLPDATRTEECVPGRSTFEVPDGSVFVMGDNRGASRDARCWQVPSVEESAIVGRAFVRIWPVSEFGGI